MAAAASISKFHNSEYVVSLLDEEECNIIMYFVHGELTAESEIVVPPNSILIQTGEGASFGCTLDTSADTEILHWFLHDREKAFRMLMGAETMQVGVLSFFQYKVEGESLTFEKVVFLTEKDLEKNRTTPQIWGIYLIDQITNKLIFHDKLTNYLIDQTKSTGGKGITQTQMMLHTNEIYNDKPNIHIFVNCATIPKSFPLAKLAAIEIPTGGPVATRSVTRHVEANKNFFSRKNLNRSRNFEEQATRKVAGEIRKKLKAAYRFEADDLRKFRKTIHEKAAQLVRYSLGTNSKLLKTYLDGEERKAIAEFVAGLLTPIQTIVYDGSLWTDSTGSAERRRRTRRRARRA